MYIQLSEKLTRSTVFTGIDEYKDDDEKTETYGAVKKVFAAIANAYTGYSEAERRYHESQIEKKVHEKESEKYQQYESVSFIKPKIQYSSGGCAMGGRQIVSYPEIKNLYSTFLENKPSGNIWGWVLKLKL